MTGLDLALVPGPAPDERAHRTESIAMALCVRGRTAPCDSGRSPSLQRVLTDAAIGTGACIARRIERVPRLRTECPVYRNNFNLIGARDAAG